jgi:hypothetical protein
MSSEQLPTAEYYRNIAEEIRQIAEAAQVPEVRRDLFDLAKRFRRMAEYAERRDPCRLAERAP